MSTDKIKHTRRKRTRRHAALGGVSVLAAKAGSFLAVKFGLVAKVAGGAVAENAFEQTISSYVPYYSNIVDMTGEWGAAAMLAIIAAFMIGGITHTAHALLPHKAPEPSVSG